MVQAQILELLVRLTDDLGLALVLVTHDLPVVAQICERAAVMYAGEIVEMGPMEALYHDPRHPYTRLLFAATPDLTGKDARRVDSGRAAAARPRDRRLPVRAALRPGVRAVHAGRAAHARARPGHTRRACHLNDRAGEGGVVSTNGTASAPLLEVEDLVTRFPVPPRPRSGRSRAGRSRPCTRSTASRSPSARARCSRSSASPGCGKTTTAQTVMRLVDPVSGTIRFEGQDITRARAAASCGRSDGACRSSTRIRTSRSTRASACRHTIEEPLLVHGLGGSERRARAEGRGRAGRAPG